MLKKQVFSIRKEYFMYYYDVETNELNCASLQDLIILKKARTIENSIIVTKTQAEYIFICDDCGEIINTNNADDYYITFDNRIICDNCYIDGYFTCEDCYEVYPIDNEIIINPGLRNEIYVCPNCANRNYYQCEDCGEYHTLENGYTDSNDVFLCNTCYEEYYTCTNCGCFVHCDIVYWSDANEPYCLDCFYNNGHNETYIHSYGYIPYLEFYSTENDTLNPVYYGFELEVSADEDTASGFLNNYTHDNIYLTYDGSIKNGGYEITSHPMTYDYIFNSYFTKELENSLNYLKSVDAKGHNYGGLHIHINRNALSRKEIALITAFIYNDKNYDTLLKITQRQETELAEWASIRTNKKPIDVYNKVKIDGYFRDTKYNGINFLHTATYEFRIFNSNIRIDRLKKNFQFVKLLIDYSKYITSLNLTREQLISHTLNFDLKAVFNYALNNSTDYRELLEFLSILYTQLSLVA